MKKFLFAVLALALLSSGAGAEKTAAGLSYLDKLPPIIDRDVFFGDPEIAGGQISPDGKYISFRKTFNGQLNIWVKGVDEPFESARPMTADSTRPVIRYGWTQDGRYILYIQDKGGDENFHAYVVDPAEGPAEGQEIPKARDLTPIDGIRATFYSFPEKTPDIIYLGLNDRDERYHDVYRVTLSTGERELIWENTQELGSFIFDLDGNLRMASKETADGGTEFFRIEGKDLVSVYTVTNEENANIISFQKDGKRAYMITNKGDNIDLTQLVLFDPSTGATELVEQDPENEVDFSGVIFSNVTKEIVATTYEGARLRIYWKDKTWEKAYKDLKKKLKKEVGDGDILLVSSTNDDCYHIVVVTSDINPGVAYLYNMETGDLKFLYKPRPNLPSEHLASMKPVKYTSRDGLTIHGYLTVPKGVKSKNLAVVALIHGGPWARDSWGYNSEAQFLANRGYAVFQPNFRASTGYGKNFFNAGKRKWGDEMQNDVTDGVEYLIDKGIADPAKVAIYGGSYGGYTTLAGLAFTPDLYVCGVDYVGVSNLLTLLKSIPPYWETARKFFDEHVGNPDNPEDVERLTRQSPLFSADKIKAPLLVVQGANDPRCKVPESQQIVVAMRDLGRDVEYLIAKDEGHGFLGRENRTAFYVAMEKFFAKHIGGRSQESVPEDIQKRLDEMWIPIETVKIDKPEGDLEAAKTAPLPGVDGALVKAMKLKYDSKAAVSGQEIPMQNAVEVSKAKRGGQDVWRVLSIQTSMMGSGIDTFDVGTMDLMPIYRGIEQGSTKVRISYSPAEISGKIFMGGSEMPIVSKLEAPVYGSDSALEIVLCSLPLAAGYKTTLRTFDVLTQSAPPMSVVVTGIENVTVPAGAFEAFKLELRRVDGEPGGGTYYINTGSTRFVIRSVIDLPPMMGGGTITSDLSGVE